MQNRVQIVDKRPSTTQQTWDRQVVKARRKTLIWRIAWTGIAMTVVFGLLALFTAPLAFG